MIHDLILQLPPANLSMCFTNNNFCNDEMLWKKLLDRDYPGWEFLNLSPNDTDEAMFVDNIPQGTTSPYRALYEALYGDLPEWADYLIHECAIFDFELINWKAVNKRIVSSLWKLLQETLPSKFSVDPYDYHKIIWEIGTTLTGLQPKYIGDRKGEVNLTENDMDLKVDDVLKHYRILSKE